ncbi:MAG: hypothetical protein ACE5D2_08830 [Fidelibacterota bacterium]
MEDQLKQKSTLILFIQILSLSFIWLLVVAVITWILNLISLSNYLKDAQNATLGISIVVMPIFALLAGVLTYVFVGLKKGKNDK